MFLISVKWHWHVLKKETPSAPNRNQTYDRIRLILWTLLPLVELLEGLRWLGH